jgi:type I restriction enzyme, S subunit
MSWPSIRLADLCEVITKGTTPTTLGFNFSDNEGIRFLRAQNIDGGSVNYERDTLFIDERTHRALERSQIRPRDILISIAGTIGRAGVVPDGAPALNCNQAVAIVRTNESVFRPFLRHWLDSPDAQTQMRGAMVTGTISNLSLTQVGNLRISLPPFAEQRRIAEVLDRAEALRAKRRGALAQVGTLTQAIFLDLFGDPASNPKGWQHSTIGEAADQVTDGEHLTPRRTSEGIKLLSARNIRDGYIDFGDVDYISSEEHDRIKRRCNPTLGDVLISCSGTIGRVASVETYEPFSLVRSVALVRPKTAILNTKFFESYLRTPAVRARMLRRANASSQANLFQGQICGLPVFIPPLSVQFEFARRVAAVQKLEIAHRASLTELGALFASLQHRAFRGEL